MAVESQIRLRSVYSFNMPHGVTAFVLKIAAIIGMTANHVSNVFALFLPPDVALALYCLGGITFPVFAFLLIEGYIHTSNLKRYFIRLAIFAVISQIPYSLLWGPHGNVLITIFLGLAILYASDKLGAGWGLVILIIVSLFSNSIVSLDWGGIGPILIFMFYELRKKSLPLGRWSALVTMGVFILYEGLDFLMLVIPYLPVDFSTVTMGMVPLGTHEFSETGYILTNLGGALYYLIGSTIAMVLMLSYNGRQGPHMKWFFYCYYPGHLFVLWIIAKLFFI